MRLLMAVVAGIARDLGPAVERQVFYLERHLDHLSRRLLFALLIRRIVLSVMTKAAVNTQRRAEDVHDLAQLIGGNIVEHLDVFEPLSDRRHLLLGLGLCLGCPPVVNNNCREGNHYRDHTHLDIA